MTTVSPTFDAEGNYIGSEIDEGLIPNDIHHHYEELNPFTYDESTGEYEAERLEVAYGDLDDDSTYEYLLEQHVATSEDATPEQQAIYWLDRGNISEEEVDFLARAIAEVDDEYEREKAESLLLFKLGQLEYHLLPEEVREQLDQILGFDSSNSEAEYYEDEESYDDTDDEEEESPELVEALTSALPDLAAMAEQEGQEELQFYFEANQMLYDGEITDAEYKAALINAFGVEGADEVAELGTSIALEFLGIA